MLSRHILYFLSLCFACGNSAQAENQAAPIAASAAPPAVLATSSQIVSSTQVVETGPVYIAAIGDVLPHEAVKKVAEEQNILGVDKQSQNHGGYDFLFARVKDALSSADLAIANLETPVAPKNHKGTASMVFNAPTDLLDALKYAGVDMLSYANNHVYDQGRAAFSETIENIESRDLVALGAGKNEADAWKVYSRKIKNINLCVFGMTRLLNGNLQPNDTEKAQVLYVPYGKEAKDAKQKVLDKIPDMKKGCDVLLMSVHWGVEYKTEPYPDDVDFAYALLEAGVDGILGHHPHVLEPLERRQTKDGRDTFVAFSMGNFVSNQGMSYFQGKKKNFSAHTRDSMVLRVGFEKEGDKISIKELGYYAAWTDRDILPTEVVQKTSKIIRAVLIDQEIAEAKDALAPLLLIEKPSKKDKTTITTWKNRISLLETRRSAIGKTVGENFLLPYAK